MRKCYVIIGHLEKGGIVPIGATVYLKGKKAKKKMEEYKKLYAEYGWSNFHIESWYLDEEGEKEDEN